MMCVSINGPGDLDRWPFDLETGVRVASSVGSLPSKFGHARPLGYRIIRYVCDGRTDGRTNKSMGRGVIKFQSVNDATDHCQHWLWASGNTEGGHLITYAYKLLTRIMSVFYRFYLENFGTCVRKRCFSPLLTHEWSETFWYCEA